MILAGPNATSVKIKKESEEIYSEHDKFNEAIESVGNKTNDPAGRITYKLKEECLQLFDPFLLIKEDQMLKCSDSYIASVVNTVVGDYKGHYKFQTDINCCAFKAIA